MKIKLLLILSLLVFGISSTFGSTTNSKITGSIETLFLQANRDFVISPNPATSSLNVYLPAGFENAKLTVFDVLGKVIYDVEMNSLKSSINISKWNSGVYLVKISTDKATQTKRFVKQ
ncbi:putative secreted protein (Por secretion system target) [Flavobacteriaceae bacterium MAR_2010_72]|nr:putative secreted protein (Por secretion system target) [Flavobacteriaceae bacterium MAR_2010_72]TVZ59325.1 putative secreted protein (Por secretion system target) [Flavobacteriaceae bacterium MAR_2010_105]